MFDTAVEKLTTTLINLQIVDTQVEAQTVIAAFLIELNTLIRNGGGDLQINHYTLMSLLEDIGR
jgi:hypothetical protein